MNVDVQVLKARVNDLVVSFEQMKVSNKQLELKVQMLRSDMIILKEANGIKVY